MLIQPLHLLKDGFVQVCQLPGVFKERRVSLIRMQVRRCLLGKVATAVLTRDLKDRWSVIREGSSITNDFMASMLLALFSSLLMGKHHLFARADQYQLQWSD